MTIEILLESKLNLNFLFLFSFLGCDNTHYYRYHGILGFGMKYEHIKHCFVIISWLSSIICSWLLEKPKFLSKVLVSPHCFNWAPFARYWITAGRYSFNRLHGLLQTAISFWQTISFPNFNDWWCNSSAVEGRLQSSRNRWSAKPGSDQLRKNLQ